ncbi:gliding motility-associated protein GldE [uncultured Acetobacteroides sp.]|uniref:gliding motility-associated protein GldE n=1 Tax=uncultured Acetobacteroides sp. TaxID=1760811 RepID=UPI0029F487B1|nr:gliding motility-associated protein GldE [uncultured Acetobacteroides sp.]
MADSFPDNMFLGLDVTFHSFSIELAFLLLTIIVLIVVSGLIAGSEVAYFSLSLSDKNKLSKKNSKSAGVAVRLLSKSDYLLSAILFASGIVNVAIVILSGYLINSTVDFRSEPTAGLVFQIVAITLVLLLFGQMMPRILAAHRPLRFVLFMARPLVVIVRLFKPLSYLLISSSSLISKRLFRRSMRNISMDDLSEAIDIAEPKSQESRNILKGIVEFVNTEASEIMTPRLDVVGVDVSDSYDTLRKTVFETGYSRILAYEDSLDNVKGILYIKDLLPYLDEKSTFGWASLIRNPYFVPENKKINDLLEEFQAKKIHLAVVVDEYGGTCGIVSLEDILEEIVGEISDESDFDEEKDYVMLDGNTYLFEGKTLLNDFVKVFEEAEDVFDEVRGEAETLAGLLLEIKGDFLQKGEELAFGDFTFRVDSIERRRIKKVKVTIQHKDDEE